MNGLLPIYYWRSANIAQNVFPIIVTSTTVPFCFNNEWYTITQEDLKQQLLATTTYTINKLSAIQYPPTVLPINNSNVNYFELAEVVKFMMNAAVAEQQRRASQSTSLLFNPFQQSGPNFNVQQATNWSASFSSSPFFHQAFPVVAPSAPPMTFHYDKASSTDDLVCYHQEPRKRVSFAKSQTNFDLGRRSENLDLSSDWASQT